MQRTAGHAHCLRCGRALRSAHSTALGYGPTCLRKVKAAALVHGQTSGDKPEQVAKATELIEQGGLVPLRARRVFQVVASDGVTTYRTAAQACTCPAGLRGLHTCYHRIAAQIVTAA
ncbi:DUF6011 domain-containing protein [Streptomyces javensis]|uniref:SWIM-type domain-containing protein n=1 Tax=Streptomyces javensis TaxID=114698 RepID=A0ABS0R6N3_9ACTN|nr:DUF6011 domain-containing protein [Streptomyces javensis]MBI0313046.1 hypothetical protein [Streptomyces javensis]